MIPSIALLALAVLPAPAQDLPQAQAAARSALAALKPSTDLGRARALLPAGVSLAQALADMGVDVQTCPLSPAQCAKMTPDYAYVPKQGYQRSGAFLVDTGFYRFSNRPGVNTAKLLIKIYPSLKDPKQASIRLDLTATKPGILGGPYGFVYLLPHGRAMTLEAGHPEYCEDTPGCRDKIVFSLPEPAALLAALLPYTGSDGKINMQGILMDVAVGETISRWDRDLSESEQDMSELKAALPQAGFSFLTSYDNTVPFTLWGTYRKKTPGGTLSIALYYSSLLNLGLNKAEVALEVPAREPKKTTFRSLSELKEATAGFTDFDGLTRELR